MLKRLQWRFIAVTMSFLTLILFGTLFVTYTASSANLDRFVESSLNRVLNTTTPTRPYIGVSAAPDADETIYGQRAVVWVDIDEETGEVELNDSAAIIGPRALEKVLEAASGPENEGVIDEYSVVWKEAPIPGGERIAIASDVASQAARIQQFIASVVAALVVLVVAWLFIWRLSRSIVQPVRLAWEAQRQFTSDASHELKTPLAVIRANTDILREHLGDFPEKDRRWIRSTDDEITRMQVLVNDLLELSKADEAAITDHQVYRKDLLDFSALAEEACLEFEVMAFERGRLMEEELEQGLWVLSDGTALDRVVRILLDNAVKYASKDAPIVVRLTVSEAGTCLFSVNNHGEPLSEDDVAHIFDRFYRSDGSRSRQTGGFGLGLAIARSTMIALGGDITCTSSAAAGTTFTLEIPLDREHT